MAWDDEQRSTTHRTARSESESSRRTPRFSDNGETKRSDRTPRHASESSRPNIDWDAAGTAAGNVVGDILVFFRDLFRKAAPYVREYGPQFVGNPTQYLFTAALLLMEVTFKVATIGGLFPSIIFIVLFSLLSGQVLQALTALVRPQQPRRIVRTVVLAVIGVIFAIEYFVYRQFKHYYDIVTVVSGAGGVATQFGGAAAALIFTPTGILCILLFLAPAVLYWFLLSKRLEGEEPPAWPEVGLTFAQGAAAWLVCMLLVLVSGSYGRAYTDRYNFQSCVTNFGLVTGLRKDAVVTLTGGQKVDFEDAGTGSEPITLSDRDRPDPEDYGRNELDIDFEELAASTDGTWASLDNYVATLTPSSKNEMTGAYEGYNLIFISAEAFSAEAIREDLTPTLYRMANEGIQFTDYYQFDSAGTTGGECANLLGMLATEGGNSVKGTANSNNYMTIGNALNRLGYNGWAFHNNTYTYYDRQLTHNNLGYNNGYMGYGNGMEEYVTWQWPQSDLEMIQGTYENIYRGQEPFNVYYMSVSGHSGYLRGDNMMTQLHWDEVADLDYSEPVRGYLACNIELDRAMEWLINALEEDGIADHTLIVIGADHFPYGLDNDGPLGSLPYLSELYGYDVTTYFQRDHNRLIMWSGSMEDEEPIVVDEPVMSIDVLPTLLNMFGCEFDSRLLPGRDVFSDATPLAFDLSYDWRTDLGTYYASSGTFEPNEGVEVPDGYVDQMNSIVANKISYMHGVLTTDYYAHVFGPAEDVQTVHDRGVAAREKSDKDEKQGEDTSGS